MVVSRGTRRRRRRRNERESAAKLLPHATSGVLADEQQQQQQQQQQKERGGGEGKREGEEKKKKKKKEGVTDFLRSPPQPTSQAANQRTSEPANQLVPLLRTRRKVVDPHKHGAGTQSHFLTYITYIAGACMIDDVTFLP